jgi:hypothetical protein
MCSVKLAISSRGDANFACLELGQNGVFAVLPLNRLIFYLKSSLSQHIFGKLEVSN